MRFFGYEENSEKLIKLREATFDGSLQELDELIDFLENVREEHSKAAEKKRYVIRISRIGAVSGRRKIRILL